MKLTPREAQVLRLAFAGESRSSIARTLGISPHTVRNHRISIMAKAGTKNALQLGAWAQRNGYGVEGTAARIEPTPAQVRAVRELMRPKLAVSR